MTRILAAVMVCGVCFAPTASAIPALQIYSPDATYDASLESWIITDDTFELWVVGAVGSYGPIMDVTLAASYYGTSGSLDILPGLPIDTDYATKEGFTNGVQNHAEFANADGHYFYDIGDFTGTSDTIQDYQPGAPSGTHLGEIKKYSMHVTGYDAVHFDAFDHYATGVLGSASYRLHPTFSPFSHDATGGGGDGGSGGSGGSGGGGGDLPEPGALILFGSGLAGLLITRRRR